MKKVPVTVDEDAAAKQKKEAEQKQLRSQLKKAEENIERLEKEIKEADQKLADPKEYEKLMNDQTFFAKYNTLKK